MREVVAAIIALFLLIVALSLAAALQTYRLRRQRSRDTERAMGRTVIAELPAGVDLILFSEDPVRFYYGAQGIDKDLITGVRLLVNGAPIASTASARFPERDMPAPESVDDVPEGILRDRWDVAIDTLRGTVMVECGAIRERVSQELARAIYEAVKKNVEL
jgi:hypothetical protein